MVVRCYYINVGFIFALLRQKMWNIFLRVRFWLWHFKTVYAYVLRDESIYVKPKTTININIQAICVKLVSKLSNFLSNYLFDVF